MNTAEMWSAVRLVAVMDPLIFRPHEVLKPPLGQVEHRSLSAFRQTGPHAPMRRRLA